VRPCRQLRIVAQASSTDDVGTAGLVGIAAGLISNPVVAISLYTLKTTGAGLPPGPGGLYGAIGEHKAAAQGTAHPCGLKGTPAQACVR
jgi:hypothetical protein